MNMYAYVGNDPVNKFDPTGMWSQSYANSLRQHQGFTYTPALVQSMIHGQRMDSANVLKDVSDIAAYVAAGSALFGAEPVALAASGVFAGANLAAGAISPDKGSLAIATAEELTGKAVSIKMTALSEAAGAVTGKVMSQEARANIGGAVSELSGEVSSDAMAEQLKSNSATNAENGMSGSVVKICSGMGAQQGGC
jgi:hypothetical protein